MQNVLLNQAAIEIIKKHEKCFHSMHFTDKYSVPPLGMIKPSRQILSFKFKILSDAKDPNMESLKQLVKFAFRFIDLVVVVVIKLSGSPSRTISFFETVFL